MRFTSFIVLSVVAATLGAPSAMRREQVNGNVYFCTEKDFKGKCGLTPPVDEKNCQGSNIGGWIKNPVNDLSVYGFNKIASSFQCKNP
ncbi:unnamed protein product [Rhizoctonia solani]|uniref:Uncharacterized protein n=1 Tax=Rhizoctonia solani TaxID=456999 RepID=A0A8H3CM39_9AGAM|nr:unnamed protein product [Rhizoctonia solani]